jgi:hypothetical protein
MSLIYRTGFAPVIILILLLYSTGRSQVVGNPIEQIRMGEVGVGLALESLHREMEKSDVSSHRLWLKASYGITDWWTVSGMGGGGNLYFNPEPGAIITTFRGSFEWGYGGTTKMAVLRSGPVEFFGFGGGIRIFSSGIIYNETEESSVNLRYDWQEFFAGAGFAYYGKRWALYGGMEERAVRWCETESHIKNVSKTLPNILGGFEYRVSGTLFLNMQFKFLNEYSFVFGISEHNFLKFND